MAERMSVKVIAPVPLLDYSRLGGSGSWGTGFPRHYSDGAVEVFHPRWLYPPRGGWFNAVCLFLAALPCIIRIRRRFPFQIIDAHFAHPEGIAAAMLASVLGLPFTVTLRGNETMHAGFRLRRLWIRWALCRAALVIAVSESLRQFAIGLGVRPERARTIPNGIDVSIYYPRDRTACRERLGLPAGKRVILSAGYLIERKGHHHVIRAISSLRAAGIDVLLWIVGGKGREGDYEAQLKTLVRESGLEDAVHFTGAVPAAALAEYMAAADVFCLASSREGWPNVVNEALGCGTPVVASDVGGVPDMLRSEEFGFVVPAGDSKALEEALASAVRKSWDRSAIAAWGQSRSWQAVAAEVAAEFMRIAKERA
jgi:glycosyltransferase involved in cell wall biosynthesis